MAAASPIINVPTVFTTQYNENPTYRTGATGQTLYSTAAAVLIELQGSATKVVRLRKLSIWAQAGTKFFTELTLSRVAVVSAGTPQASPTGYPCDTSDPAATAVVNYYAAAAAASAAPKLIGAGALSVAIPSATMEMTPTVWDFARVQVKPIVLRGTADILQVANTITGLGTATYGFEIEWDEANA